VRDDAIDDPVPEASHLVGRQGQHDRDAYPTKRSTLLIGQAAVTGYSDIGGNRLTLLARAGELLSSPGAGEQTLERLANLLVKGFADWCAIDVLDDHGEIIRAASAPDGGPPLRADRPHGPAVVMRTGEPELLRSVPDELVPGATSYLCVPLLSRDQPWGAITLVTTCSDRRFGPADLDTATELARRAVSAVETQRLLESLASSEERYRLLFEANPLPMWVYDARTLRFLAVNEAAVRHYGYTRAEFLGMSITDIRPREDVDALLADLKQRGGPGSPTPGTWRHRKKDGTIIDVEITAGKVTFEGRQAALVLSHDVTERLRLEERLAQAEKMEAIGRLAGGVAHDFNNLLTVISGYAEILLAKGDTPGREQLSEIAHAAEQAAALTRSLLAFSRRQVLHPRVLDLNDIVAGMEPMVRRIIGDDVSVGVRLAPGLAPVEADQAQLERVILNLAANARDAMPDGGRLTIETANVELDEDYVSSRGEGTPGPNVLLAVSDTGVGMSEEVQRHLFEPFFTTKSPAAGTGLGLSTVFGVVKQSGGSIFVYSEEGRGTTFKIYLPAAAAERVEDAEAAGDLAAERGSETIMVVEDDESVRDLVRLMLESKGYNVLAAAGAEEAERICTDGVDLLLTDVVMPDVNGRVLAERLSATSPSMRILFMSGYSDEAVYRHGEISPDASFIEKPFTDRTLARKVREVLDGG
jgi:two-component system cell cycle sensor histidine kinase/response regulator CckA